MIENNHGPETSEVERIHRHVQQVYARKTHERQVFMEELQEYRKKRAKNMLMCIRNEIGPRWYQSLSVQQRRALDKLSSSIYQDILEGRPKRTSGIMRLLGLYPRPNNSDLLSCIFAGRHDPKEMLAHLYLLTYGYPIEAKQSSYGLNARLMLSGILYLGFDDLISLLRERFKPDPPSEPPPKPKPKPEPPVESPYLQRFVVTVYEKPKYQRPPPLPLPNLEDLNEPYEEEPIVPKPPPPPPPPPPPKKRLPQSLCDRIAGIKPIQPHQTFDSDDQLPRNKSYKTLRKMHRLSKLGATSSTGNIPKKKYGIGIDFRKRGTRRRKPRAPSTGLENAQYTINGVYTVKGKTVYVLGNVSILPPQGDLIHGGFANKDGIFINVHCGFRARPPPPKPDPCDCVKKWQDTVFNYIKENKCLCGHHYDYGNEGNFPPEEVPFFIKPTRQSPLQFNYHSIFDLDPSHQFVEKKFKNIWETESMLYVDEADDGDLSKKDKMDKKKKKKKSSKTCLGERPTTEDYLKCALRFMRKVNIAARLPDLHLVPELKEWMRFRIHGPMTPAERAELLRKSTTYWRMFTTLSAKGYGHVSPPVDPLFSGNITTWAHKHALNEKFQLFTQKYKLAMYRSHAAVSNLLWRSMYQAEFPDKKFREIFYSYIFGRIEDWQIMHPYNAKESQDRMQIMGNNRYVCLPPKV